MGQAGSVPSQSGLPGESAFRRVFDTPCPATTPVCDVFNATGNRSIYRSGHDESIHVLFEFGAIHRPIGFVVAGNTIISQAEQHVSAALSEAYLVLIVLIEARRWELSMLFCQRVKTSVQMC
jgi:hypothetical protein